MDLTEAFVPGGGGGGGDGGAEDLSKTDFFDFVVSPSLTSPSGTTIVTDEENYLNNNNNHHHNNHHHHHHHHHHRGSTRRMNYIQESRRNDNTSTTHAFIKETNNNTLTALPPVSTITGSLNHHSVRTHCIQNNEQMAIDQSDCDYWTSSSGNGGSGGGGGGGVDDGKEQQTCSILLEDLNKYCWSAHSNSRVDDTNDNDNIHRISSVNDRQNTDGAIYTLTVLNNETNSMDGLDCCKSPVAPSNDTWSLRPNLDLDAILSLEQTHDQTDNRDIIVNTSDGSRNTERYHIISTTPTSQYTTHTDDSGFVESKELCRTVQSNPTAGDNNNDWKLSDQNHLQDVSPDSAESLLRNALQGKLYPGPAQITIPTTNKSLSPISVSTLSSNCNTASPLLSDHHHHHHQQQQTQQTPQQQQQQQLDQQDESMHACTEEDLLLSQLETTAYRPGDYEKLKSIANEVVESYCNLEPVCNVTGTTTVMYTLDPTSGSLGTITLPADLGQVGTVTVVTTAQADLIEQSSNRSDDNQSNTQVQVVTARASSASITKTTKKYKRNTKNNSNNNNSNNNNNNNNNSSSNNSNNNNTSGNSSNNNSNNSNNSSNTNSNVSSNGDGNQHQTNNSNSSPSATVPRKERSLHYCSICSKGFKDKYSVNVHIRTHTGEKPFACSLCGKSFRQKAHLAKHYQTHVTQKPNVGNGTTTVNANNNNTTSTTSTTTTCANSSSSNPSPSTNSSSRGSHSTTDSTAVCSPLS